jgi:hypothetical protein
MTQSEYLGMCREECKVVAKEEQGNEAVVKK